MHDFTGGHLPDAGKTFPRPMDLVIAASDGFVTFHFKIALVFKAELQFN